MEIIAPIPLIADEKFSKIEKEIIQTIADDRYNELVDSSIVIDQLRQRKIDIHVSIVRKTGNVRIQFDGIFKRILIPQTMINDCVSMAYEKLQLHQKNYTEENCIYDIKRILSESIYNCITQVIETFDLNVAGRNFLFNDFGFFTLLYLQLFKHRVIPYILYHDMFMYNVNEGISLVKHFTDTCISLTEVLTICGEKWVILPSERRVYYYNIQQELTNGNTDIMYIIAPHSIGWLLNFNHKDNVNIYESLIDSDHSTNHIIGYHEYMKAGHPHIHIFDNVQSLELYMAFNVIRTWSIDERMNVPSEYGKLTRLTYDMGSNISNSKIIIYKLMSAIGIPNDMTARQLRTVNQINDLIRVFYIHVKGLREWVRLLSNDKQWSKYIFMTQIKADQYVQLRDENRIEFNQDVIKTVRIRNEVPKEYTTEVLVIRKPVIFRDVPLGRIFHEDLLNIKPIGLDVLSVGQRGMTRRWSYDYSTILKPYVREITGIANNRLPMVDDDILFERYKNTLYWSLRQLYNKPLTKNGKLLTTDIINALNLPDDRWRNGEDQLILWLHAILFKRQVTTYGPNHLIPLPEPFEQDTVINNSTLKLVTVMRAMIAYINQNLNIVRDTKLTIRIYGAIEEPLVGILNRLSNKWTASGVGINAHSPNQRSDVLNSMITRTYGISLSDIDLLDTKNLDDASHKLIRIIRSLLATSTLACGVKIQYPFPTVLNAIFDAIDVTSWIVRILKTTNSPFGSFEIFLIFVRGENDGFVNLDLFDDWFIFRDTLLSLPVWGYKIDVIKGMEVTDEQSLLTKRNPQMLIGMCDEQYYHTTISYMLRHSSEIQTGNLTDLYGVKIGMIGIHDVNRSLLTCRTNNMFMLSNDANSNLIANRGMLTLPIQLRIGVNSSEAATYNLATRTRILMDLELNHRYSPDLDKLQLSFLDVGGRAIEGIGLTLPGDKYVIIDTHPLPLELEKYGIEITNRLFTYLPDDPVLLHNQIIIVTFCLMNGENNLAAMNEKLHNLKEICDAYHSTVFVNLYTALGAIELMNLDFDSVRITNDVGGLLGTFGAYDLVPLFERDELHELNGYTQLRVNMSNVFDAMHKYNLSVVPGVMRFLSLFNDFCPLFKYIGV